MRGCPTLWRMRRSARRKKYFLQRKAEAGATEQSESFNENDKETSQVTINPNLDFVTNLTKPLRRTKD